MEKIIKNAELINVANSLAEFMQYEMPIKIGWNLKKNMNKIQCVIKSFAEFEEEIVRKYAVKIDDKIKYKENGQPEIYPAKQDIFKKEHTELLACENTIDFLTIKLSDLEGKSIKPSLLFNLEFMIEDDLDEKK